MMTTGQIFPRYFVRTACLLLATVCLAAFPSLGQRDTSAELQIEKTWETKAAFSGNDSLVSVGTAAFVLRENAVVDAFSLDTGKKIWSTEIGGTVGSNLVAANGSVYVVRRSVAASTQKEPDVLRALSAATGITKWSVAIAGDVLIKLGIVGNSLVAILRDGTAQSFDVDQGTLKWKRKLSAATLSETYFVNDKAFVIADGNSIVTLTADGSETKVIANSLYPISTVAVLGGDSIVWGDERGNLTLFNRSIAKVEWQFKSGARISHIVSVNGLVIAASNDNFVYALSQDSGNRIWKKRVQGRIAAVSTIGDYAIVVQQLGEQNIIFLNSRNGKTSGQLTFPAGEFPVASVVAGGKDLIVLSDSAIYRYKIDAAPKKKSGPGEVPASR